MRDANTNMNRACHTRIYESLDLEDFAFTSLSPTLSMTCPPWDPWVHDSTLPLLYITSEHYEILILTCEYCTRFQSWDHSRSNLVRHMDQLMGNPLESLERIRLWSWVRQLGIIADARVWSQHVTRQDGCNNLCHQPPPRKDHIAREQQQRTLISR